MNFDQKAGTWDDNLERVQRAHIIAAEIIKFTNPDCSGNALEFGCGTGLLSSFLKESFKSITLVDSSNAMIDVLKRKIESENISNFIPICADDISVIDEVSGFDSVYTLMTLHHIQDLDKLFKTFYKKMNDNAILCIADIVTEDGSFHSEQKDFIGSNGFDKAFLRKKLLQSGFETKYYKVCYVIKKNVNGEIKDFPVFLLIAKRKKR